MKKSKIDAVIMGSGIAGLFAALKCAQKNLNVLVVTKSFISEGSSNYAQGGIVGVLKSNLSDNVDLHVKDTLIAGDGLCVETAVRFISENSDNAIKELISFGTKFDMNPDGSPKLTLEGAHCAKRILHAGGDATGFCIEKALVERVRQNPNITVKEYTRAIELIVKNNVCEGIVLLNNDGEFEIVFSKAVLIATGGAGQIYADTTNPETSTGDGIALALRAGAVIKDMEFVQFHPTAFALKDKDKMFLLSEAVRGEGAVLTGKDGTPFMKNYDSRADLASRDIVARAVFREMHENNLPYVYLDATKIDGEKFKKRFPTISAKCLENGIDPSKDKIPAAPAAHYLMGGIKTNLKSETSIKRLFAAGEAACTGLHGANRLASNSLLECVVTADAFAKNFPDDDLQNSDFEFNTEELENFEIEPVKEEIKTIMNDNVGIIRNEKGLNEAFKKLSEIKEKYYRKNYKNPECYDVKNMIDVAMLTVQFAKLRKESRGGHFREDFPDKGENIFHIEKTKDDLCLTNL